jgi:sialate O-acetylesterase
VIDVDTLLVSSPDVPDPVAVRYAWTNAPKANLFGDTGLPAAPFRSDAW